MKRVIDIAERQDLNRTSPLVLGVPPPLSLTKGEILATLLGCPDSFV